MFLNFSQPKEHTIFASKNNTLNTMTNTLIYPQFPTLGSLFAPIVNFVKNALALFTKPDDAAINIDEVRERSTSLIDRLFDDSKEFQSFDKPPGNDQEPEEKEPEEEEGEEKEPEEKEPDEEEGEVKPEEVDFESDETMARKTAKENGRKLKELETRHADLVVKNTEAEKERDELRQRLQQYEQVTIDPRATPAYQEVLGEMWRDVDAAIAEELPPAASGLSDKFGKYVAQYLPTLKMESGDRAAAVSKLKQSIATDLNGLDTPYEELLEDDRIAADELARQVLAVIRRNAPRATKLMEIESEVRDRAKKGRLATGLREFEDKANFISATVQPVGSLSDSLIEKAPDVPEAIVARMAKEDSVFETKLKAAKSVVAELLAGSPKPLTESEMDALEEQGIDLNEYQKRRMKEYRDKIKQHAPLLVRGLALASLTNKTLTTYAKEHLKGSRKRDELEILNDLSRKSSVQKLTKEQEEAEARKKQDEDPRKRPLATKNLFE